MIRLFQIVPQSTNLGDDRLRCNAQVAVLDEAIVKYLDRYDFSIGEWMFRRRDELKKEIKAIDALNTECISIVQT